MSQLLFRFLVNPKLTQNISRLKQAGVDRLGIALDAATEAVFNKVKGQEAGGCYGWENQFHLFSEALSSFWGRQC